jgi:hypothetical protein
VNRIATSAATVALGLGLLAGCGGDEGGDPQASGGDYCTDLRDTAADISAVTGGDLGSFDETTGRIERLRDEAPAAVEQAWARVGDAIDTVVQALREAGIDEDDLTNLQNGDASLPPDIDMQALQQAMGEAQALGSDEVRQAFEAIAAHARDECDLDLGATP